MYHLVSFSIDLMLLAKKKISVCFEVCTRLTFYERMWSVLNMCLLSKKAGSLQKIRNIKNKYLLEKWLFCCVEVDVLKS